MNVRIIVAGVRAMFALATGSAVLLQQGCGEPRTWTCMGTAIPCRQRGSDECASRIGCHYGPQCAPVDCEAQGSQGSCENNKHCFWGESGCITASELPDCSPLDAPNCSSVNGCSWLTVCGGKVAVSCRSLSEDTCNSVTGCYWHYYY